MSLGSGGGHQVSGIDYQAWNIRSKCALAPNGTDGMVLGHEIPERVAPPMSTAVLLVFQTWSIYDKQVILMFQIIKPCGRCKNVRYAPHTQINFFCSMHKSKLTNK